MIALTGATIGKVGVYQGHDKYYLNQRVGKVFNINKELVNKNFLEYFLQTEDFHKQLLDTCEGKSTAQDNISVVDVKLVKMPLPSIEDQKKIVEYLNNVPSSLVCAAVMEAFLKGKDYDSLRKKLEALDRNIELTKAKIEADKEYMKILLEVETEHCEQVRLGDVCTYNYGTRIVKGKCGKGDVPVYGGGGITFYTDSANRHTETLVISRFGMSLNCVRVVKGDFFLNDSGMSLTTKDAQCLNQRFLQYYMLTIHDKVYECNSNNPAQKSMDITKFKELKIPLPSIEQQYLLVETLDKNDDAREHMLNNIVQFNTLKQQCLHQVLNNHLAGV